MSSFANLTRKDGIDFMQLVEKFQLQVTITPFPLENVSQALAAIRNGILEGSSVLIKTIGL